ncbi:ROK family protein [Nocardioides marmotae]|uniref:ROK family protein n=1 Tax=Nocardioides marmotae TaxID=2663857 RepID=UPI0013257F8C|nr:ROK family protein [Nocardioides marmotae]MBC9732143.1 ROK family protein [Nocardioides marmotae]MTB83264.1 ROK family protein [Nocardioides marmotae]
MSLHIGVDVGGTKVLAAEVDADGTVRRTARRATPGRRVDAALVEQALTEAVAEVAGGRPVDGVGLAAAGFVDAARERVVFAPHLPWQGDDVRRRLAERWGTTVALDNDANCAALAESALGAAVGVEDFLLVTMGTGIGGAVVLGGRVRRGRNGMAGEFGHTQVVPDGRPCECGGAGCWEQYASGNALVRHARSRLGQEPTVLEGLCGGDPDALVGPMVTEAAAGGDAVALAAFASVGDWLGVGIANLVASFDPPLVVVGGGVSAAGDLLLEPARRALARSLVGAPHRSLPPVVRARFGPEAGVVGGALLVRGR